MLTNRNVDYQTAIRLQATPQNYYGNTMTISDGFGPFSDGFGRFRIVFGPFRTVSDRFGPFLDRFRTVFGPFRTVFGPFRSVFGPFRIVFGPFRTNLFLIKKFQISIGQGWGTAVADRRSARRGQPPFRGQPQPWPIEI